MKKRYSFTIHPFLYLLCWSAALACFASCSGDHASFNGIDFSNKAFDWKDAAIQDFAGISSVEDISDSTALISWPRHEDAHLYIIYYRQNEQEEWKLLEGVTKSETAYLVRGLNFASPYSFMVKALNEVGVSDTNTKSINIHTNLAPNAPSALSLKFPSNNISFTREPVYTVRGVKPGETVRLFKNDATCQEENKVGQAVVAEDQTAVDITSSSLGVSVGRYTFYANATSAAGHTSPCSLAFATYTTVTCPSEFGDMYVPVEGNEELGTTAFCIMKTEARDDGHNIPISTYEGLPWVRLHTTAAKNACQRIEVEGGTCDLPSNAQWMTIARDIEAVAENWNTGEVGSGMLNRGHSDTDPGEALAISDLEDPWNGTGQDSSTWSQKRTHQLSNGEVLWDFAGNVSEWVDWSSEDDVYTPGPNTCPEGFTQLYQLTCEGLAPNDYLPGNPAGIDHALYNSNYGLGQVFGTSESTRNNGGGGAAVRGGSWRYGTSNGIYYLRLSGTPASHTDTSIGFRCVCLVSGQ